MVKPTPPRRLAWPELVLREGLTIVLTAAAGVLLIALVIFAPRIFLASAPLAGVGARQLINWDVLRDYLGAVSQYAQTVFQGSLGTDRRGMPVAGTILPAARRTFELLAVSIAVALPLGLGWGTLLASARGRLMRGLAFGLNTLLNSLPSFVVMLLAIELVTSITRRTGVRLTFVQGYGFDRHLVLPALVLALRGAAYLGRALQIAQEEIMQQDWIRAARARGLGGLRLWRRHVLPALRLPLLGASLGMLRVVVAGAVIVDYVYNWSGLGSYMLRSATAIAARFTDDRMTAGAAVVLMLLFVGVDALGRLALRGASAHLREGIGE